MNPGIVIIGGMMSWPQRYEEMRQTIASLTDCAESEIPVVPLYPTDWAKLLKLSGWNNLLQKTDSALSKQADNTNRKLVVIGHSMGGVIGKLLAEHKELNGRFYGSCEIISAVVGLGSPFESYRVDRILNFAKLRSKGVPAGRLVPCLAVAGRAVKGDRGGSAKEKWAYQAYEWHVKRGDVQGDLMIPEPAILVEGVKGLRLEGVYHEKFISPSWYCAPNVVRQWWPHVVEFLNDVD